MLQEALMETLSVDEVYIDRLSGKNMNRPELLQKMMEKFIILIRKPISVRAQ